MTSSDGILCIDPLGETKTQNHSNQVNYYLQKGGPAVLSLNDNVSRHKQGDLIKIPKGKSFFLFLNSKLTFISQKAIKYFHLFLDIQYKFRNVSKTEKAYFYFQFL